MKKFSVTLTRDVTESCTVIVEAESSEAAFEAAKNDYEKQKWEVNDNYYEHCYLADEESIEEVESEEE